jgi:hypothetical protein
LRKNLKNNELRVSPIIYQQKLPVKKKMVSFSTIFDLVEHQD